MYRSLITEASAADLAAKYYSDLPLPFIGKAMAADPTVPAIPFGEVDLNRSFGTFTKQILAWMRERRSDAEWPIAYTEKIRDQLTQFMEIQKFLPPEYANINKFPTARSFNKFMSVDSTPYVIEFKEARAAKESSVFYEDAKWIVRVPKTYFASNFYAHDPDHNGGYEASWCTSYSANHWNHYTGGTLLMILHKHSPSVSVQMFLPSDGDDPVLKDYHDDDATAGAIPPEVRSIIEDKFGVNLKGEFGFDGEHAGEEVTNDSTTLVRFGMVADYNGREVEGSIYAEKRRYDINDDVDVMGSLTADFTIARSVASDWRAEDLASMPAVNFAAPGYVAMLPKGGDAILVAAAGAEWPGLDLDVDVDVSEMQDSFILLARSRKDGEPALNGPSTSWAYRRALDRGYAPAMPVSFAAFLFPAGLSVGVYDELVSNIKTAIYQYSGADPGNVKSLSKPAVTFKGSTYDSVIWYNPAYGGLKEALQDPAFREHVQGAGVTVA